MILIFGVGGGGKKRITFLEGSQASLSCPAGGSGVKMRMYAT